MESGTEDISTRRFVVCIDEVQQNFVFGDRFSGRYTKAVTLSNGTTRTIELTAMIRDGVPVVELKDTGHRSYMGLNGTTTNGKLMVQIRDFDAGQAEFSALVRAHSRVLPRKTSLLTTSELVPPGFAQGIEILNDDTTPMNFVVSVLGSHLGLGEEDAARTMVDIHRRGGVLLPTSSMAEAERIAAGMTAQAAASGYPLICRAVSVVPGTQSNGP